MGKVLTAMEMPNASQPYMFSEHYVYFLMNVRIQLIFTVYETERWKKENDL